MSFNEYAYQYSLFLLFATSKSATVWDALALHNELLDQVQIIFVDGGFGSRFRQQLAQRGIQLPTGVLAQ
ncbi:hypothetical protein GCM10027422_48860 [Hymenobacter arcticus]